MAHDNDDRLGRRAVIRRLAVLGTATAAAPSALAAPEAPKIRPAREAHDPDFQDPALWWDRVLTPPEMETVTALCDLILPADAGSVAASALGIAAFVDEWISAPYPLQQADQQIIRGGLSWLDIESHRRFGRRFAVASTAQKTTLADLVADPEKCRPGHKPGARMFDRVRAVAMIGFYSTPEGWKDLGYVGNTPSGSWEGPPIEVLRHLKLV